MVIAGEIQRSKEGVVHLMANRVTDVTAMLAHLSETQTALGPPSRADEAVRPAMPHPPGSSRQHPRDVRILPRSRDFH